MINLVSGGAGFIGSHLIDRLLKSGECVISIDNLFTGKIQNLLKWENHPNFKFINHDIINPIDIKADKIWHLACPASPAQYQLDPINTAKINFLGSLNMLEIARKYKSKILLASTSEVYGNPEVHPQKETYSGNVNSFGIKSCYYEGKRIAESLFFEYKNFHNVDTRLVRIFNTYGPRMQPDDGRVVSNFIVNALKGETLIIYGNGEQTRSFCYINDLINGLINLMNSNYSKPINIGNPCEYSIISLAKLVIAKISSKSNIKFMPITEYDPLRRKPDINLAMEKLNWSPEISLDKGLDRTIKHFKKLILR